MNNPKYCFKTKIIPKKFKYIQMKILCSKILNKIQSKINCYFKTKFDLIKF